VAAFLLLDGDRNFRRALEIELRMAGAQVTSAEPLERARSLFAFGSFDVCVVDSLLTNADALLDRAASAGMTTIAVGPHPELLDRAARRHQVATLEKPFSAAALLALCRALAG
jgi:DNA-binding NtrC family response regulator